MTPIDKARQLFEKFRKESRHKYLQRIKEDADEAGKKLALIAVDEILYLLETLDDPGNGVIVYWKSVKNHIQSL